MLPVSLDSRDSSEVPDDTPGEDYGVINDAIGTLSFDLDTLTESGAVFKVAQASCSRALIGVLAPYIDMPVNQN